MSAPHITFLAEDAAGVSVKHAAEAQQVASYLRAKSGWEEVVAGLDTVTVRFDPLTMTEGRVHGHLHEALANHDGNAGVPLETIDIPVQYGGASGPDLAALCETLDISESQFIARHTRAEHVVDMIGFTPGFAYVSGLEASLSAARLATPRARVPAGSLGISGGYTGLYALQGPGGWPLIGRTDAALFDAGSDDPFLLTPGQRIRFVVA